MGHSSDGSKGGSVGCEPHRSKFFQFHAVFGKIWQNRMLAPHWRVGAPTSEKSWICHYILLTFDFLLKPPQPVTGLFFKKNLQILDLLNGPFLTNDFSIIFKLNSNEYAVIGKVYNIFNIMWIL